MRRTITILLTAGSCLLSWGATAGAAPSFVNLEGKRVTVALVGGISVTPCPAGKDCTQGIVQLGWGNDPVGSHHVRCLHPQHLGVVKARQGASHTFAWVYACRRSYRWQIR